MMLHEKHRPRSLADIVGHEKTIKAIRLLIGRQSYSGGALWIDGPSGTGKTTLARCLASELGASDWDTVELDGDKCDVQAVRDLERDILKSGGLFGGSGWRVWIVNEAHAMTTRAVQAWLTLLERLPPKRLIVFTTTQGRKADLFGDFSDPLMSRCLVFSLSSYGLKEAFAERAKAIAEAEGLDGQPIAKYQRLVADNKNNLRAVLSAIEAGEMIQ